MARSCLCGVEAQPNVLAGGLARTPSTSTTRTMGVRISFHKREMCQAPAFGYVRFQSCHSSAAKSGSNFCGELCI